MTVSNIYKQGFESPVIFKEWMHSVRGTDIRVSTTHWPNVGLMLCQRHRRSPNIKTTLVPLSLVYWDILRSAATTRSIDPVLVRGLVWWNITYTISARPTT